MAIRYRTFVKAALAIGLLTLPYAATAQTVRYVVFPLAETASQTGCVPTAIGQQGEVVGYCTAGGLDSLAVVWRSGAVEPLGKLSDGVFSKALAINSAGTIVGEGDDGDLIGKAIVHRNGQWIEIDGSGGSYQAAMGITDAGVVFGRFSSAGHPGTETMDPVFWVFDSDHDRYDRFDLPKAAGTPSTGFSGADVWAASRFGIAVGGVTTDLIGNRGAMWMNDSAHTLVLLAGLTDRSSAVAAGVSDDGRTVGWAFGGMVPPAPPDDRAVMWLNDAGHTLVDIGTLPGDAWSRAVGVNTAGQVVGASYALATVPRGFIFENSTLTELTALLDPVSAAAGWTIGEAAGINNDGIIIATGRLNGEFHPVMLLPTEAPADTLPPEIALTSPASGSTVSGEVAITAAATDNVGVTHVVFLADGQPLGQSNEPDYSLTWDTRTSADGKVVLTARAFDAAGNEAESAPVEVTVANHVDVTPPVITVPGNVSAEATGPTGAAVTFAVSATDDVDGSVPVSCSPPNGSTFALGTTTVNCTASDAAGNQGMASFPVTVQDTTNPVMTVPSDITVEASQPVAVTFTASATDSVDGVIPVTCNPPSGSIFALGSTTVGCTATDAHGNEAAASFVVQVQRPAVGDTTAPVLTLPPRIRAKANAAGTPIAYTVTAIDNADGEVPVTCTPPSGSLFFKGKTTVNCEATDSAGNSARGSFIVQLTGSGKK
jgi:uncharacterized membrane protein